MQIGRTAEMLKHSRSRVWIQQMVKKKKCNVFKEVNKSSVRQRHIQNDRWRGWETYKQYISPGRFKPSGCGMQLDELWHWS